MQLKIKNTNPRHIANFAFHKVQAVMMLDEKHLVFSHDWLQFVPGDTESHSAVEFVEVLISNGTLNSNPVLLERARVFCKQSTVVPYVDPREYN
jgi:hypothetical protein